MGNVNANTETSGFEGMECEPTSISSTDGAIDPSITKQNREVDSATVGYADITAPDLFEIQGLNSTGTTKSALTVAYKREDLANDAIVMHIVRLMKGLLNTGDVSDIPLITYNVLPTGPQEGMIEF